MKIKHILTLLLLSIGMIANAQTFDYQLNYNNIKVGKSSTGILQFNGLATFVNSMSIGGTTVGTSGTPAILVNRALNLGTGNSRGFRDNTSLTTTSGSAFSTFDVGTQTIGTGNFDHLVGFQSRPNHNSSGSILDLMGFSSILEGNSGSVTNMYAFRAYTATGAATVTNNYGIFIDNQNKGTNIYGIHSNIIEDANRWNIYAAGTAKNYLNGNLGIGINNADVFSRGYDKILGISSSGQSGVQVNSATGNVFFDLGIGGARTFNISSSSTESYFTNILNNPLYIGVNNSTQLSVTTTGLGVKNFSPSEALDVTGNGKFSGLSGTGTRPIAATSTGTLTIDTGGARLAGGNTFTGVQTFSNGTVQPSNAYTESGFVNALQSNTLTTNVNTYLPSDGGTLLNNSVTGWAVYSDNVYTSGSPYTITSASTVTLPNNAATVINTQIPVGVTSFYNSSTLKITPQNDGDYYVTTIRFKAKTTAPTAGYLDFGIDIGGSLGVQFKETKIFAKGAGIEHNFSIVVPMYTAATFLANGGQVKLTAGNGDMTVYDISYQIDRTHKAK